MIRGLLAAWKLARALAHAFGGLATILFVFPRLTQAEREGRVQAWARRMLQLLGIGLELRGQPPAGGPVLLVANHISWLDILVMHAARYCRFVSKADVKHWPLIGTLATGAGTLYIERESRRDAMRVVHQMAEALTAGDTVAVFPEGTTGEGHTLLPFHANLLQASIATGTPVQPVALRYRDRHDDVSKAVAYVGDTTLVQSLWWVACSEGLEVQVQFLVPQASAHAERRALAERLRAAIDEALQTPPTV